MENVVVIVFDRPNQSFERVNKKLDLLYYDGLHPQKKQGHPWSVQGELKLVY